MDEAKGLNIQDESAHLSSLNKTPVSILQEYAMKNLLLLNFIEMNSENGSFKYNLRMDEYSVAGTGCSKKEAKHVAASKLIKKMIEDKPDLLNTAFQHLDLKNNVVSPFDNNVKINAVGQLNEICSYHKLDMPEYNLVREEGHAHAKLFTMSCCVAKMTETATHKTKKQAKQLASLKMIKKFESIDQKPVREPQVDKSFHVVKLVEEMKMMQAKKSAPIDEDISNYHLLFKNHKWKNTEILNSVIEQYKKNNKLVFDEPFLLLQNMTLECEMNMVQTTLDRNLTGMKKDHFYVITINNVYPPICGTGISENIEEAKNMAAIEILTNICILSL